MAVAGIICEYNPFHEGHKYMIRKVREKTGADTVVAVMNGDFVQRGAPAVVDKYTRARMALLEGADLVFELPVRFGISSAQDFAYGGILALELLSFVDFFCFGSESGEVAVLREAGRFFAGSSGDLASFEMEVSRLVRSGMSYPAAREAAFWRATRQGSWSELLSGGRGVLREGTESLCGKSEGVSDGAEFLYGDSVAMDMAGRSDLFAPNNLLGMEYIKAAELLHSRMEPVAIRRAGMGYRERGAGGDGFLSATAIRENMSGGDLSGIPEGARGVFAEYAAAYGCFLDSEPFWAACSYAIRSHWDELERFKDVSEEIAGRFRACLYESVSFADFVARCKAKHMTMTRICRCVFQVLLGVEKSAERERRLPYIRLLGMRSGAAGCLRRVGDAGETVVVARVSRDSERLDAEGRRKLEQDIRASDIYRGTVMAASGKRLLDEYKRRLITI